MTPVALATAIVDALRPTGRLLEPCAGDAAFVQALARHGSVEWCEQADGRDFLNWTKPVDWVVTNPPWSQFRAFLEHALAVADEVAMLATVNHWWTRRRVTAVRQAGFGYRQLLLVQPWPRGFPQSGFQLGVMHVSRGYKGPLAVTDLRWEDDATEAHRHVCAECGLDWPCDQRACRVERAGYVNGEGPFCDPCREAEMARREADVAANAPEVVHR